MKHTDFLRSNFSHPFLTSCTLIQRQCFGRMLKKYREGKLKPLKVKRHRSREFIVIEEKLIQYLIREGNKKGNLSFFHET